MGGIAKRLCHSGDDNNRNLCDCCKLFDTVHVDVLAELSTTRVFAFWQAIVHRLSGLRLRKSSVFSLARIVRKSSGIY